MMENLAEQDRHEMDCVEGTDDGVDEFLCSVCGRRIAVSYPPRYRKIVLVAGDGSVDHIMGKGGVSIPPRILTGLEVYEEWMTESNFDRLWE